MKSASENYCLNTFVREHKFVKNISAIWHHMVRTLIVIYNDRRVCKRVNHWLKYSINMLTNFWNIYLLVIQAHFRLCFTTTCKTCQEMYYAYLKILWNNYSSSINPLNGTSVYDHNSRSSVTAVSDCFFHYIFWVV